MRYAQIGLASASVIVVGPARSAEFATSDKVFADFVQEGFDVKGTWGGHVIILQKGDQVALCEVVLKNDLFYTIKHGCSVVIKPKK